MSEYWSDQDPKFYEQMAEPLAKLDPNLASDIKAMHWSRTTVVFSQQMETSLPTSDQKYIFWLFNHADAVKHVLGSLVFREVTRRWPQYQSRHGDTCLGAVNLDMTNGKLSFLDEKNRECTCSHADVLRPRISKIVDRMLWVQGRLHPTLNDLWDLYERWRLQYSPGPPIERSWRTAQLAYSESFRCQIAGKTKARRFLHRGQPAT